MYAYVLNNIVVSVSTTQNSTEPFPCYECPDEVQIGWEYVDGVFAPMRELDLIVVTPLKILSKLEYMNLFTDTELEDIYTTAKTVIQVEVWLEKFKLAAEIDLNDERTIGGVNALETAGLLAVGRAAEILAGGV